MTQSAMKIDKVENFNNNRHRGITRLYVIRRLAVFVWQKHTYIVINVSCVSM